MARTNYSYEKRGRELEKQKKKEEKRLKKLAKKNGGEEIAESEEGETTPSPAEDVSSEPFQSTE
ncbi:MAG: hypothetical protein U9Q62_11725 [Campylobacterota bacterium]|nr:hypothetical protein [Campylobacterota bacterium]